MVTKKQVLLLTQVLSTESHDKDVKASYRKPHMTIVYSGGLCFPWKTVAASSLLWRNAAPVLWRRIVLGMIACYHLVITILAALIRLTIRAQC